LILLHRKVPAWTTIVLCTAVAAAYSPSVLQVFNLLADYDALALKSEHFFFHNEAVHLLSIARPVAALLSNLPVLPVESPQDFRWVHAFSLMTLCVVGVQMVTSCIVRLHTTAWDAIAVSLAVFLGLAFVYAVLESTAWTPHLLTTFIAFAAYATLSRSNVKVLSFLSPAARRDYRVLARQSVSYFLQRPVWQACLIYQVAFYTYPPFALLMTVFPVIAVLFSRAPLVYRNLIALRDVLFVAVNLALYSLTTSLIYLPVVRLFTAKGSGGATAYESEYVATLYAGHQFLYNTSLSAIARRLGHLATVSADLWFLPQTRMHIVVAIAVLLALGIVAMRRARDAGMPEAASWVSSRAIAILIPPVCFIMAASPILLSAGGFVAYRTSVAATAVVAIIFVFAVRRLVGSAVWLTGRTSAVARAEGVATALTVCAAFAATTYANFALMRLGTNEYAYFTRVVRQAIDDKSRAIVLIDPRPWIGAQGYNMWPVADRQGRPVPPLELACFSSYCMQTGSIVRVIAAQLGVSGNAFELLVARNDDPVPGLTCEMLDAPTPSYPPNATRRSIELIDRYRNLTPRTCVTESLAWHDLGLHLRP
jgi:hypothetical protein